MFVEQAGNTERIRRLKTERVSKRTSDYASCFHTVIREVLLENQWVQVWENAAGDVCFAYVWSAVKFNSSNSQAAEEENGCQCFIINEDGPCNRDKRWI